MDSLDAIGLRFGTDKSSLYHDYLSFYEALFAPIRHEPIKLLEVGVAAGASLKTWEAYFPNATIIGCDITAGCRRFEAGRVRIEIADQSNIQQMTDIAVAHGPFDVVVEDGSHLWAHQIITMQTLFPFVRPGGIYIVEDLQTNFGEIAQEYRGHATISCVEYLKRWIDLRVGDSEMPLEDVSDPFLRTYGRLAEFITFYRRAALLKKSMAGSAVQGSVATPLVASARGEQPGVRVVLLAHVSGAGDVQSAQGYVNRGPSFVLQGLSIDTGLGLLEYRVRGEGREWTHWHGEGAFAGTRGEANLLTGVAVRLRPEVAERYRLRVVARCFGRPDLVEAGSGEDCAAAGAEPICGLQIRLSEMPR